MQYEYPIMLGYRWNAVQKISRALGIPMDRIYTADTATQTLIGFHGGLELTPEQKAIVDNIMANGPCDPDLSVGVTYRIADLWGMRQWFINQLGMEPIYWFSQEQPDGSGECYIYLNFPRALNATEKKKVVSTYQATIGEVL